MQNYADERATAIPTDQGLRDMLAETDKLVHAIDGHLDGIEARLFGQKPSPVGGMSEPGDASIPPVYRAISEVNRRLSILQNVVNSIRDRL
jgi:hypothetical protein